MFSLLMHLKGRRELQPRDFKHLIGRDDPTILEVGCNGGEDTERFIEAFPSAVLYCFEPDDRAAARFRQRFSMTDNETSKAHGTARVHLLAAAVGAATGEAIFHVSSGQPPGGPRSPDLPEDWDLSGSIKEPTGHLEKNPWVKFEERRSVPVVTLDNWRAEKRVEAIDLIWADVQGAEADLISGGRDTLNATQYFYTECNDGELYEGQIGYDAMRRLLPKHAPVRRFENDALFKRRH